MRRTLMILAATAVAAISSASVAQAGVSPTGAKSGTTFAGAVLSAGSVTCTTATFTATWGSPTTPPLIISTNMQLLFSGCRGVGGAPVTISCSNSAVLTVTGRTGSGITPMTLTSVSCRLFALGISCTATMSGAVNAPYDNVPVAMTVSTTGQTLTVSGSTCTAIFPNGSTTLSAPGGGALQYQMTPPTTVAY